MMWFLVCVCVCVCVCVALGEKCRLGRVRCKVWYVGGWVMILNGSKRRDMMDKREKMAEMWDLSRLR